MLLDTLVLGKGLADLWSGVLANWITPVYLAAVAVGAFMFIRSQQLTKLIMFLVVAAIVGVLIFAGDTLFGQNGQGGALTNMFAKTAEDVGTKNKTGLQN